MAQSSKPSDSPDVKTIVNSSQTPSCLEVKSPKSPTKSLEVKAMAQNLKTPASPSVSREGGEGGDSSWEDQESSDNNRLEIDEPKKKKVRRKRVASKHKIRYNNVEVPDEIIQECSSILDNTLDNKARNLNMSSSQVKMVLKSVIQSPELLAMLRNVGAATVVESDPAAAAEPKMTRAMTKKCQEVGDSVWIVPPVTPQKPPNAEIVSLLTENWPEEGGDDPDFTPDLDPVLSDDDSLFSLSEQGTPSASQSACSVYTNTPNSVLSESRTVLTPTEFKRPKPAPSPSVARAASRVLNFEGALNQAEGYATRSRMPLTDTTIEQLEQQFIPFDITPDMYELNCDNDDYSEFLKTLYAGQPEDTSQAGASPLGPGFDDPTDPEFVFPVDEAEIQLRDHEELRDDRATKITKKEVSELMAELLHEAQGTLDSDPEASDARGKRKSKQPPGSAIKKKRPRVSQEPVESEDTDRAKTPAQVVPLTEAQIAQLRTQVQQHTQLITQMGLLSSHSQEWKGVRDDCDNMLSQMLSKSLLTPLSVLSPDNLYPSLAALKEWDDVGSNPTLVRNNKNAKKKRHSTYHITEELMDFMTQKSIFQFPSLLPISGLSQTVERITWQPSEDQLLAQAIERLAPDSKKFGKRHMTELSFAISSKAMPAKTPQQIQVRIKNLKQLGADDNPVKRYYEDGVAPDCEEILKAEVQLGSSLMDMVANGRRDDIPALWLTHVINSQTKIKPPKLTMISPKPIKPIVTIKPTTPPKILFEPKSSVLSVKTVESAKVKCDNVDKSVFIVPNRCGTIKSENNLMSTPAQILCVDGTNGTPGSTSDSDTPSAAGSETMKKLEFTSPPENKFTVKKVTGIKCNYPKSPLKAARDRILKKYTSPHKRPLREIRKRPVLHPIRMSPMKLKPTERLPITPRRLVPKLPAVSPVVSVNTSPTLCASPQPDEEDRQADPVTDTPTGPPGKRGTRRQKEAEATLALLGELETAEEKELREARESAEMFEEICNTVSDNASLCEEFDHIMSVAMDVGTCQTYLSLHRLLDGHPLTQELLLDLLSPEDAIKLGFKTRVALNQRRRMKRFVLKLGRAYQHQPAYHAKVLRELEAVSTDQNLTPNILKQTADRLFKNNQHLLDEFLSLVPGVPTPESMLPSPETLHYPEDSDQSWASDEMQMETITCRSPSTVEETRILKEETRPSADEPKQPCKCPEYLAKPGPCRSCNVRFVDGEVFIMDGKILKPAHVQGWGESVTTA